MYENYVKRFIDIMLSTIGLIVFSWLFLVIAIVIVFDNPGPVIFTQKRVGRGMRDFAMHKFRSMKMDTPREMPTHLLESPEMYITRVGKFLRKTSLDELPQLYDVLIGNMSLIGPRPALRNQEDLLKARNLYGANDIKPGVSGWAQLNGRDELPIEIKAEFDGEYAQVLKVGGMKAFLMDMKCILLTVKKVIRQDGIVEGKQEK